MNHYVLDEHGNPRQEPSVLAWADWVESSCTNGARRVALTERDGVSVSTVFLSVDHNFTGHGAPLLWETWIDGGPLTGDLTRYATREEAVAGHALACERAFGGAS